MKLIIKSVPIPESVFNALQAIAGARKTKMTLLIREAISAYFHLPEAENVDPKACGHVGGRGKKGRSGSKHGSGSGGDLARFKSAETHARVCAKMREARALKRIREKAKLLASKQESGSQGGVA